MAKFKSLLVSLAVTQLFTQLIKKDPIIYSLKIFNRFFHLILVLLIVYFCSLAKILFGKIRRSTSKTHK